MVHIARLDRNWRKNGGIPGALVYMTDDNGHNQENYIPFSNIRVLRERPFIEPRKTGRDDNLDRTYEAVSLGEA